MVISPAAFLSSVPVGTRVVARYRIADMFTDALGYLRSRDSTVCVIETKRGDVVVPFTDVVAAKQVPPPPERRAGTPQSVAGQSPTQGQAR